VRLAVTAVDDAGHPLDAVVPVEVQVLDPAGRPAEYSGWYGARDGRLEVRLDVASNDTPGLWRLQAHELASGRRAETYLRVTP
jgi:hypothetical protein